MVEMLTDEDFDQKMAFAAGFTQNMASIGVHFDDDTLKQHTGKQKVPPLKIDKDFFEANNITRDTTHVKTMRHFDSAFRAALDSQQLAIEYSLRMYIRQDSATPPDSMSSRAFIIDAMYPKIHRVVYAIPHTLIWQRMLPYTVSGIFVMMLVTSAFIFYRRSYRMQMQMAQFKESLFSNITHELKTPVSSLQLILDAANDNEGTEVTMSKQHVSFARSELNRMKLNIDKILSVGKLNSREFELDKELVNLDGVIIDSIDVMGITLAQRNGSINYKPTGKVNVLGDRILLMNMLTIVIDNAIKYNVNEAIINIALKRDETNAIITIEDNGIGIPAQYHKRIFEPFFRVPTGNRHDVKGHGLGLSFTKQVVALHKGSISVESSGRGSTFIITIPIA